MDLETTAAHFSARGCLSRPGTCRSSVVFAEEFEALDPAGNAE
jgi:hypothetical protein